ncbi:MAG: M56 family metallopeptidase [Pseudohongiella sp.]|nr:M56 family metallopeptidase [Pseudohongiella sp.]
MDNMFLPSGMVTSATALMLLDLLLKSAGILSIFALLDRLLVKRMGSNSQHLLWINALICLSLLPVLPALIDHAAPGLATSDAWLEITVTPASVATESGTSNYAWLLILYFIPTLWLLAKMVVAVVHLRRIQHQSEPVANLTTLCLLSGLAAQLNISRSVVMARSHRIDSPISFGLIKPHIILPAQSDYWSASVMTDVLLHELSHIKRLDWITMMLAWIVAAFYWINPLVWYAIKRLGDEAENSCDTAVLLAGRSDTDYAESLLSVAQACVRPTQSQHAVKLPVQMMQDSGTLKTRIHRILEDNTMNTSGNKSSNHVIKSMAIMLLISAATLFGIGSAHLVSAQIPNPAQSTADDEMIPLHHVEPVYPTRAAQRKIGGWVKVSFTVTAAGTVDTESIDVVDSEPRGMFENSARRAASEFSFTPRIRNGAPVDVPNVQYMFRYSVSEESERRATP